MKRTKEDMLITRQRILDAGFDCFFEKGYEATSLVEVADRAELTRGAIYWHFENKLDLYHAVVDMTLEHGDVAKYFSELQPEVPLVDRLDYVFWKSLGDNRYVDFVFKTLAYTNGREEFRDIYNKLARAKQNLLKMFQIEVTVHIRMNHLKDADADSIATGIYLLFEGMFLTKNVPIGLDITKNEIHHYLVLAVSELIPS